MKTSLVCVATFLLVGAAGFAWAAPFDDLEVDPPAIDLAEPAVPDPPNVAPPKEAGIEPASSLPTTEDVLPIEPTPDDNGPLAAAQAEFMAGNVDKCLSLLRDAVAADPHIASPELNLAAFSLRAGLRSQGLSLLEKVAAEDAPHPQLHILYANLALGEGRLTEALMHFDKLETDGPPGDWSDADKRELRASILAGKTTVAERRRNWEGAQQHLAKWLQLHPDDAALRYRWARSLLLSGKESKAVEQFDIAHRQNNQLNRPEAAAGAEFMAQGNYPKANSAFAAALEKYPDDGPTHYAWAMALLYQDRAEEAVASANRAAELGMDSQKLDLLRGVAARATGANKQAVAHFERVLKTTPNDREATYQLILALTAHQEQPERERALKLARVLVESQPRSPTALAALGLAQRAAGNVADAHQALAAVAGRRDARPEVLLALGQLLAASEKPAAAKQVAARLKEQMAEPGVFVERQAASQWLAELPAEN